MTDQRMTDKEIEQLAEWLSANDELREHFKGDDYVPWMVELQENAARAIRQLLEERRQWREVEKEIRRAFPHFMNGEAVTPEAMRKIGDEWLREMMMDPGPSEIKFFDHDGNVRKIVFEPGDYEVGISSCWIIPEDANWEVHEITPPQEGEGNA